MDSEFGDVWALFPLFVSDADTGSTSTALPLVDEFSCGHHICHSEFFQAASDRVRVARITDGVLIILDSFDILLVWAIAENDK